METRTRPGQRGTDPVKLSDCASTGLLGDLQNSTIIISYQMLAALAQILD
jgi:hypothetical protein